jgi:hypothetical protein
VCDVGGAVEAACGAGLSHGGERHGCLSCGSKFGEGDLYLPSIQLVFLKRVVATVVLASAMRVRR